MKKLSELRIGESGIIKSFTEDDMYIKLMEMGCVPGETVRVDQIALLGDPISVSIAGYQLSLRLSEANMIWVDSSQ